MSRVAQEHHQSVPSNVYHSGAPHNSAHLSQPTYHSGVIQPAPHPVAVNQPVVEEVPRPNYSRVYPSNVPSKRLGPQHDPAHQDSSCPPALCGLLALLGVIGLVLALLFGLGILGGGKAEVNEPTVATTPVRVNNNNGGVQPAAVHPVNTNTGHVQPTPANTQPVNNGNVAPNAGYVNPVPHRVEPARAQNQPVNSQPAQYHPVNTQPVYPQPANAYPSRHAINPVSVSPAAVQPVNSS